MDNHECKEIKEVVIALADLTGFLAYRATDGVQVVGDGIAIAKHLFLDRDFQAKLAKAIEGIQNLPKEAKDELAKDGIQGAVKELFGLGTIAIDEFTKSFKDAASE